MASVSTASSGFSRLSPVAKGDVGILALFLVGICALLWSSWQHNPDLSHGFFMPLVFLALLYESRTHGTQRWLPAGALTSAIEVVLLLMAVGALVASGLFAAALGWSHALVNFTLVSTLVFFLGAGLVHFSNEKIRLIPCNWNAVVAIGLWWLSSPMPLGTYARVTLKLQLWVSENVLRALHVLGVAAHREGNVIELAGGTVGVEEACSGVRSLISCVFAGLFFSASLVKRPLARVLVVGLAVPLALLTNFARSLILTLLTNAGVDITGKWHDVTGFAVLGVTSVLLGGFALLLERRPKAAPISPAAARAVAPAAGPSRPPANVWLTAGLLLATALLVFFWANTHASPRQDQPVPDLLAVLPATTAGWQVDTTRDLYRFASQLQTDHLAQRTYLRGSAEQPVQITVYLAYWKSGQASVSQVASHTPDACWPGAGWEAVPRPVTQETPVVGGRQLAVAESRLFKTGRLPQYVWFWHLYDGRPIGYESPYSPRALLQLAWRYGFRRDGDQLFVRVSSNLPWEAIAHEPLLEEIFQRLKPLGL